jgi:8-amino-7-oxononanoate synthase
MAKAPTSAPPSPLNARLAAELGRLESQSQLRRLAILPEMNFCSNDYLALSKDQRLQQAIADAMAQGIAVGSTGSRLLSGNAQIWEKLESELAEFTGAEAALYFNSGYAANVGLLSSIASPRDTIFSDSANHASIIDGIRLSGAAKVIFPHLNLEVLEDKLRRHDSSAGSHGANGTRANEVGANELGADKFDASAVGADRSRASSGQKFIVAESVFSMDGDRAPLGDLLALASRYGAELIVDEAHATGVFGPQGRGLAAEAEASSAQPILAVVHTCGKALAGVGAFISCSQTLKQYLINRARTFIFSTALPPYVAAQMRAAIPIVAAANSQRAHLAGLGKHLRDRLQAAGFDTAQSDSQIVPVLLGTNERAVQFAAKLCDAGFAVRAIRPPTVPQGTARLRLSLHAGMSLALVDNLVDALVHVREEVSALECSAAHGSGLYLEPA